MITKEELEEFLRNKHKSEENFNTPEGVNELRHALRAAHKGQANHYFRDLEEEFLHLEDQGREFPREWLSNESAIAKFESNILSGQVPPPEVLLAFYKCFQKYWGGYGEISLDEAFFGRPHRKKFSPAYKSQSEYRYREFHVEWILDKYHMNNSNGHSQIELAERYLETWGSNEGLEDDIDPESFLRSYRRWLKKT